MGDHAVERESSAASAPKAVSANPATEAAPMLTSAGVLQLQHTVGNAAVARALSASPPTAAARTIARDPDVIDVEVIDPAQAGSWAVKSLPDYVDNRLVSVGYGLTIGGYFLNVSGLDKPVLLPESYVDFALTDATMVGTTVYPSREDALGALGPRTEKYYTCYQAAAGLIVPTVFSPATTPRVTQTIRAAALAFAEEAKATFTVLAFSLVLSKLASFAGNWVIQKASGPAKPVPKPATTPKGQTAETVPPGSVGAMRRLEYEPSPKHGAVQKGNIAPAPRNGQAALDYSVQVKDTSPRRVGIDYDTGDFVVFDRTHPGTPQQQPHIFHGHTRKWDDLEQEMQNALVRAGMATRRGRILRD